MIEIRTMSKNEMEQAVRLSDETFRDTKQVSMLTAFPTVFDARLNQSFGAFEGEKLVAFMGLVPSVIRIAAAKLSVLSLGSVCTHPDYRGMKIASTMLQEVLVHADRIGSSVLLVSGDGPLYMRSGCHHFGRVTRFVLSANQEKLRSFTANPDFAIRRIRSEDWFRLHDAASNRTVRYEQGVTELAALIDSEAIASCCHMQHAVFAAFESDSIAAYAVIAVPMQGGDGKEEAPFVVEWGGGAEALAAVFHHVLREQKLDCLEVPVLWYETELLQVLAEFPNKKMRNHGTVHIVNPERLYSELLPYLKEKSSAAASRLSLRRSSDGGATLLMDGEEAAILNGEELVALLFDPEVEINVPEPLQDLLDKLFPVPFPHAGGLNFV
ncbi:GNAT family N-acetyltransferase [Paenibacillus alginolyticus]|uniref:GNAT family N-acetyltransferase n=1 Tax=Paenibacillus alginolyticus TaxID=59839 RepID=A0ABT4GHJ1_9BACL|nr:GNAT family N-acetyltransferase [Paenibacillus alginolyticus]MCY9663967.1 GNAT family N-acetyltransferase [Paenibacillus alginolyticus]MCY9695672.1 GNAT family N-acetyltransferase [Paenibacillus alginolyticus]MEC0142210.1 GNAT family N-acetyltransferase [Paenibacillus alginolyticus]